MLDYKIYNWKKSKAYKIKIWAPRDIYKALEDDGAGGHKGLESLGQWFLTGILRSTRAL